MYQVQKESKITETDNENLEIQENNIFSQPWNDSDVVLVIEDKEIHAHRSILALQSDVFKAMFNGNFEDATKDRIELKGDKYEAMLQFLKLLYPAGMLYIDDDESKIAKVDINDENIFNILDLADKYQVKYILIQCMKEAERLKPENTMRLLPYAVRHELPLEKIFDVVTHRVSTNELESFAHELAHIDKNESVYDQCLVKKCRFLENAAKQANTMMLWLLEEVIEKTKNAEDNKQSQKQFTGGTTFAVFGGYQRQSRASAQCVVGHEHLTIRDFKKTKNCKHCLKAYRTNLIDKYAFNKSSNSRFGQVFAINVATRIEFQNSTFTSSDLINLLTSLEPLDNMK